MGILVIDGANVVGSRPDGWWRDREGAARRLHLALVEADLDFDQVVLVLEGKARFEPEPEAGQADVTIVNAPGSGDDAVVAEVSAAEEPVVVVTSDRGLRSRVAAAGGECVGTSWLLDQVSYPAR
jgi:predicted RNA-binding protein with PIN domain